MAITSQVLINSRTPSSVVFYGDSGTSGGAPATPITRATLNSVLKPGPLRQLLAQTPDWTVFNGSGGALCNKLRISQIMGGYGVVLLRPAVSYVITFSTNALSVLINDNSGTATQVLFEIRALHTIEA